MISSVYLGDLRLAKQKAVKKHVWMNDQVGGGTSLEIQLVCSVLTGDRIMPNGYSLRPISACREVRWFSF